MSRQLTFSIFLLMLPFSIQAQLNIPKDVKVSKDIIYNIIDQDTLILDVYWHEATATKQPLVIWIHGGGWGKGSKNNPKEAVKLLDHGYAVASINYRLSHQAKFPAQIMDCKAAIRWLKAHAAQFNVDSSRVGVWGASAGGHLSALVGTSWHVEDWDKLGDNQTVSSKVQAMCDYYGPTDFLRMDDRPGKIIHNAPDSPEGRLIGGPIQENQTKTKEANPINYIQNITPPFLILHGKEDALVLWEQSQILYDALKDHNQSAEIILFEGLGHGGKGWSALFEHPLRFFNKVLKNKK
ncbi:MAG: alpha/beta hydrolase [Bacteroidota bacterium]